MVFYEIYFCIPHRSSATYISKTTLHKVSFVLWGLQGKKSNDRSLKLPCQLIIQPKPFLARKELQWKRQQLSRKILESSQEVKGKGKKKPLVLSTSSILKKSSPVSPPSFIGSNDRNANVKRVCECLYYSLS